MLVDVFITTWIIDNLKDRSQFVQIQVLFTKVVGSTGAPNVHSLFSCSPQTTGATYLQEYPADSTVSVCISDRQKADYGKLLCGNNFINFNVKKAKKWLWILGGEITWNQFWWRTTGTLEMQHWVCLQEGIESDSNLKKLNKLIRLGCSVLETALEPEELTVERGMLHKLHKITENTAHSVHCMNIIKQQSVFNQRLLHLCCNKTKIGHSCRVH